MKIIGYTKSDFKSKTGDEIHGYKIYGIDEDIAPEFGEGKTCDQIFLTSWKIAELGNLDVPSLLGHNVNIGYNRYGKIKSITMLD